MKQFLIQSKKDITSNLYYNLQSSEEIIKIIDEIIVFLNSKKTKGITKQNIEFEIQELTNAKRIATNFGNSLTSDLSKSFDLAAKTNSDESIWFLNVIGTCEASIDRIIKILYPY